MKALVLLTICIVSLFAQVEQVIYESENIESYKPKILVLDSNQYDYADYSDEEFYPQKTEQKAPILIESSENQENEKIDMAAPQNEVEPAQVDTPLNQFEAIPIFIQLSTAQDQVWGDLNNPSNTPTSNVVSMKDQSEEGQTEVFSGSNNEGINTGFEPVENQGSVDWSGQDLTNGFDAPKVEATDSSFLPAGSQNTEMPTVDNSFSPSDAQNSSSPSENSMSTNQMNEEVGKNEADLSFENSAPVNQMNAEDAKLSETDMSFETTAPVDQVLESSSLSSEISAQENAQSNNSNSDVTFDTQTQDFSAPQNSNSGLDSSISGGDSSISGQPAQVEQQPQVQEQAQDFMLSGENGVETKQETYSPDPSFVAGEQTVSSIPATTESFQAGDEATIASGNTLESKEESQQPVSNMMMDEPIVNLDANLQNNSIDQLGEAQYPTASENPQTEEQMVNPNQSSSEFKEVFDVTKTQEIVQDQENLMPDEPIENTFLPETKQQQEQAFFVPTSKVSQEEETTEQSQSTSMQAPMVSITNQGIDHEQVQYAPSAPLQEIDQQMENWNQISSNGPQTAPQTRYQNSAIK